MAAAAEIGEGPDRVERDRFAFGDLARDLRLVRVVRVASQGRRPVDPFAGHRQIGFDDLAHPLLEPLEILGRERLGAVEIVVEAVLDRRTDRWLGFGKDILNRVREHVGGGVAKRVE
jgi:hypothetical protein